MHGKQPRSEQSAIDTNGGLHGDRTLPLVVDPSGGIGQHTLLLTNSCLLFIFPTRSQIHRYKPL